MGHCWGLLFVLACTPVYAITPTWKIEPLSPELRTKMTGKSWRKGCPVGFDDLRHLVVTYRDFKGDDQIGELVVNRSVATQVISIFQEIRQAEFPLERVELVDEYGGDDELSMHNNNTSAFNCREVAGKPGVYSKHAYGIALDLDPVQNPCYEGTTVHPDLAKEYVDRSDVRPGMITSNGTVRKIFTRRGWTWGGTFTERDYQHFDLR